MGQRKHGDGIQQAPQEGDHELLTNMVHIEHLGPTTYSRRSSREEQLGEPAQKISHNEEQVDPIQSVGPLN